MFFLASELGMTIQELTSKLTQEEYINWLAYYELKKEYEDHYPSNGLIEFMYGENQDMRSDNIKFKPEVGTILLFPSYLKHFVYPFYCDGERRSMSFNAHMKV